MAPRSRLVRSAGLLCLPLLVASSLPASAPPRPWGALGHEMTARAAGTGLPESMPGFFRERVAQLEYLNPEPDRWREREMREMDRAFAYDHYIDLENVPDRALDAPDRWAYLRELYAAGLERPERDAGFLPFRIVELYQRLVVEFRMWREAPERERPWIEERIVNDAGILGHYVSDASQPHHTTIHFDGWNSDAPNPEGYSTERGFHGRFESGFVRAAVRFEDILRRVPSGEPAAVEDVRSAVLDYIMESHDRVETLYRLDRDVGFDPTRPDPRTKEFAVERLVAASGMLRTLWWSAWLESAVRQPGGGENGASR